MSEYVTQEIQAEILKRLPLEPLLRFRSVSKSWKRLIHSPDFIASYGVRHPRPHRFILSYDDYGVRNQFTDIDFFLYDDDDIYDDDFDDDDYLDFSLTPADDHGFVGSSHGLLCFNKIYRESMYDNIYSNLSLQVVVLWNPSIDKSVRIPVPSIYDSPNINYKAVNAFGFGVCPVTFDPVILKMKWMDKPGISPWRVSVFTLSTRTWSPLTRGLPRDSIKLRGDQVVVNRFIYWPGFDMLLDAEDGRSQSPFLIMSFDLTAKKFNEINLTGSLSHRRCRIQSISKLRESLVVLEYHTQFEKDESVCCLWMMKEQGVTRSFTKLYNINVPHAKVKTLLGFTYTGKLILVTKQKDHGGGELEIYDPNSEAIVYNHGIYGEVYSFFMCSYMKSLLLLDQLDDIIYTITN